VASSPELRVLDACCGVGGATRGYQLRGLHVVGVDIAPQPDYCGDEFVRGDAVEFIRDHGCEFDFIHVSPPCQGYTALTLGINGAMGWDAALGYPKLIPDVRKVLVSTGKPYVIENVVGSPLRVDTLLCGVNFGLRVLRHRYFETGRWHTRTPVHRPHRGRVAGWRHNTKFEGPYFAVYGRGGGKGTVPQWQEAMGIDWTENRKSIAEAIPPAYTHWLAGQWLGVS
jgi:DNA (cytosine-5)-methyltransferase 1